MHYYEKNIVEIKQEYTIFLTNILSPMIYEGIKKIYDDAIEMDHNFRRALINNPSGDNANPGVLKIFQTFLKEIQTLNNHMIHNEYERIKSKSKCADFFDDLIKAVIKSNIVLLTYNVSEKECKIVNNKYHESVNIELFIHNCYIECARIFFNYPEIFFHDYATIDIKRNQREALQLIKDGINEAIRKMLPMKLILEEFLKKDYVPDNNDVTKNMSDSQYTNMRNLLRGTIHPELELEEDDEDKYNDELYNDNGTDPYYNDIVFKKYNEHTKDSNNQSTLNIPNLMSMPVAQNGGSNISTNSTLPAQGGQNIVINPTDPANSVNQINPTISKSSIQSIQGIQNNMDGSGLFIQNGQNINVKSTVGHNNDNTGFTDKIEELILNNDNSTNIETNIDENTFIKQNDGQLKPPPPTDPMKLLESVKKPKNDFANFMNVVGNKNNDSMSEIGINIDNKLSYD